MKRISKSCLNLSGQTASPRVKAAWSEGQRIKGDESKGLPSVNVTRYAWRLVSYYLFTVFTFSLSIWRCVLFVWRRMRSINDKERRTVEKEEEKSTSAILGTAMEQGFCKKVCSKKSRPKAKELCRVCLVQSLGRSSLFRAWQVNASNEKKLGFWRWGRNRRGRGRGREEGGWGTGEAVQEGAREPKRKKRKNASEGFSFFPLQSNDNY